MKIKNLLIGTSIALSATVAGTATADVVGWDFSGSSVAGEAIASPLSADATVGSAAGTFTVLSGSVTAAAQPPGVNTSDALGIQAGINGGDQVGGANAVAFLTPGSTGLNGPGSQYLGITSDGAASVEVCATAPAAGSGVRLSFGGQASTSSSTVGVSGAASASVVLGAEESEAVVWLGVAPGSSDVCATLALDGTTDQPVVDNIALTIVPEPGAVAGLGAGLIALLGLARRRTA